MPTLPTMERVAPWAEALNKNKDTQLAATIEYRVQFIRFILCISFLRIQLEDNHKGS